MTTNYEQYLENAKSELGEDKVELLLTEAERRRDGGARYEAIYEWIAGLVDFAGVRGLGVQALADWVLAKVFEPEDPYEPRQRQMINVIEEHIEVLERGRAPDKLILEQFNADQLRLVRSFIASFGD
jgi:hypothetical protein